MPLFKSLRSKSRKGSFAASETGSVNEVGVPVSAAGGQPAIPQAGTAANYTSSPSSQNAPSSPPTASAATAAPPLSLKHSTTSTSIEKKRSKLFSSSRKNSQNQNDTIPPGRPSLSTNITTTGNLLGRSMSSSKGGKTDEVQTQSPPLGSSPPAPLQTLPSGPRPSELFAGKGRRWGDVEGTASLGPAAGSGVGSSAAGTGSLGFAAGSGSTAASEHKADDLQNFLKARRQWVPTFVTEFKDEPEVKQVSKPDDIAFSSGPQAGPLMSLKDLDESHQRKQRLLGGNFLGSTTKERSEDWLASTSAGKMTAAPTATSSVAHPPSSAGRAIAINTAATAVSSTPASTVTGPPPIHASTGGDAPLSSSFDSNATAKSKKSGSISRKPVPGSVLADAVNGSSAATSTNGHAEPQAAADAAKATSAALDSGPSAATGGYVDADKGDTNVTGAAANSSVPGEIAQAKSGSSALDIPAYPHQQQSQQQQVEDAAGAAPIPSTEPLTPSEPPMPGGLDPPTPLGGPPTAVHRASMETSGTGAFATPDASAPQSEAGHGGAAMSRGLSGGGVAERVAELNQSIRGRSGEADGDVTA